MKLKNLLFVSLASTCMLLTSCNLDGDRNTSCPEVEQVPNKDELKEAYDKAIASKNFNGTYEEYIKLVTGENGILDVQKPVDKEIGLKEAYAKAIETKAFTGTYEEYLAFIRGESGPLIKKDIKYTLTIDFDNGQTKQTRTYLENEIIDIQDPKKPGFNFLYWQDSANYKVYFPITITKNLDIKAIYERNTAEVIFMNANNEVYNSRVYDLYENVTYLPTASDLGLKDNQRLLYWYYLKNDQEVELKLPFLISEPKDYVFYPKILDNTKLELASSLKADITYLSRVNAQDKKELESTINKFNEAYPNINITLVTKNSTSEINNVLYDNAKDVTKLPNIYDTYTDEARLYDRKTHNGFDVKSYFDNKDYGLGKTYLNDKVVDDLNTSLINIPKYVLNSGSKNALPYKVQGYNWYINTKEVKELDTYSFNDFVLEARRLKEKYKDRYISNKYAPIYIDDLFEVFYEESLKNSEFKFAHLDDNFDPIFEFNNTSVASLIKKYKSLYDEGLFLTRELRSLNGGENYHEVDFNNEEPTTFISFGSSNYARRLFSRPILDSANEVSTLPKLVKSDFLNYHYPSVLGFINHDENSNLASFLFYKFLMSYVSPYNTVENITYPLSFSVYKDNYDFDDLMKHNGLITKEDDEDTRKLKLGAQISSFYKENANNESFHETNLLYYDGTFKDQFNSMITRIFNYKEADIDKFILNELNSLLERMNYFKDNYTF